MFVYEEKTPALLMGMRTCTAGKGMVRCRQSNAANIRSPLDVVKKSDKSR